jgi:hypothetical protein
LFNVELLIFHAYSGREQDEKNQSDKEKRGWDGKQEKQFLTAMPWKRGELDKGGNFGHL